MDKIYVVTIDEEFNKSRKLGAKDLKKRKARGHLSGLPWGSSKEYNAPSKKEKVSTGFLEDTPYGGPRKPGAKDLKKRKKMFKIGKTEEGETRYGPAPIKKWFGQK